MGLSWSHRRFLLSHGDWYGWMGRRHAYTYTFTFACVRWCAADLFTRSYSSISFPTRYINTRTRRSTTVNINSFSIRIRSRLSTIFHVHGPLCSANLIHRHSIPSLTAVIGVPRSRFTLHADVSIETKERISSAGLLQPLTQPNHYAKQS
jgi:hypothetical protein